MSTEKKDSGKFSQSAFDKKTNENAVKFINDKKIEIKTDEMNFKKPRK